MLFPQAHLSAARGDQGATIWLLWPGNIFQTKAWNAITARLQALDV